MYQLFNIYEILSLVYGTWIGHILQGNKFVIAVKDYITRESTLLSFKRNDIIKLLDPEMVLEEGKSQVIGMVW